MHCWSLFPSCLYIFFLSLFLLYFLFDKLFLLHLCLSFIHSFTHIFVHPFIHSFIYPLIVSFFLFFSFFLSVCLSFFFFFFHSSILFSFFLSFCLSFFSFLLSFFLSVQIHFRRNSHAGNALDNFLYRPLNACQNALFLVVLISFLPKSNLLIQVRIRWRHLPSLLHLSPPVFHSLSF